MENTTLEDTQLQQVLAASKELSDEHTLQQALSASNPTNNFDKELQQAINDSQSYTEEEELLQQALIDSLSQVPAKTPDPEYQNWFNSEYPTDPPNKEEVK